MNVKIMPPLSLVPQPKLRRLIDAGGLADSTMCWTCSSCDSECPVEIATNRLRPQRIVRFANLGLIDELIALPEIWYCLTCRRCNRVCPNLVKPETLIRYARAEAVRRGVVPLAAAAAYFDLFRRFQRVRWYVASRCLQGNVAPPTDADWQRWLRTPIPDATAPVPFVNLFKGSKPFRTAAGAAGVADCFTCGECSSACPVSGERSAFDPRFIFRMVNLGLQEELLQSPSIWLCLECGRCTDACTQKVDGCLMIARLRELAAREGKVSDDFALRLRQAQQPIFMRLVDEIDCLIGVPAAGGSRTRSLACLPAVECV
jgi:heterodisulfide reductase subunit C